MKLALARSVRPSGPLKAERWTPKGECRKGHILTIKKLVIIMLIYLLILLSFSGGGCVWGLGGGMGDWVGDGMLTGGGGIDFTKEIPLN